MPAALCAPNVAASFLDQCERQPNSLFLKIAGASTTAKFTFAQMRDLAQTYNAHFRAVGLPRGAVLAIVLTHGPDLYGAFLGALMAGLVSTIVPFPTPKQDHARYWQAHVELFGNSRIRAIFTYDDLLSDIDSYFRDAVDYVTTRTQVDFACRSTDLDHHDIAALQHSSGTTALKKGVMLSHDAIHAQVRSYAQAIGLTQASRIVTWLPLYHDMGFVACFLTPMIVGCSISHLDAFVWSAKPTLLLDEIVAFAGEFVWMPNFAYHHIANAIRPTQSWDLSSVKAVINCSEPCKAVTFERFRALAPFVNLRPSALQVCYAMAENVFAVTQTDLSEPAKALAVAASSLLEGRRAVPASGDEAEVRLLSCGRAIAGVRTRIAGPDDEEGAIGEILIAGDSLYSGYFRRPDLTSQRLRNGWHHSGDIGFIYDDELYILGRVDDLLNVRGKNIYAHEVEDVVNSLKVTIPGRVVAFSVPNEALGTEDMAVVCETPDGSFDATAKRNIRNVVNSTFGVAVSRLEAVLPGTLVKTTSGKLSRSENRKHFLERL